MGQTLQAAPLWARQAAHHRVDIDRDRVVSTRHAVYVRSDAHSSRKPSSLLSFVPRGEGDVQGAESARTDVLVVEDAWACNGARRWRRTSRSSNCGGSSNADDHTRIFAALQQGEPYSDACGERADSLSTTRIQSVRFGVVWSVWSLATESLRLSESSLSQSNSQTELRGTPLWLRCWAGGLRGWGSVGRSVGWLECMDRLLGCGWMDPSVWLSPCLSPTHPRTGGRWTEREQGGREGSGFIHGRLGGA